MNKIFLLLLPLLAACATAPAPPTSPGPVVAAERAFAADAAQRGWVPAFRSFVAPDGVQLAPDLVSAPENMARTEDDHFTGLDWRPAFAGIARSGDLGFTSGPFFQRGQEGALGHYFTVWRKQADGSWKWIFDGGVRLTDAAPITAGAEPAFLSIAPRGDGYVAAGEVTVIEVQIANGNALPSEALAARLSADARVNRAGAAPAIGREAAAALLARDPGMRFSQLRQEASTAGDLVFTLGEARWSENGVEKRGNYARIWQLQSEGWRLVFDEIIPREG